MGWIGTASQLRHALDVVGADQDTDGKFKIYGEQVVSFMGLGDELVVSDHIQYSINGQRASLAGLLATTSYGSQVTVI